jgi:hypothetical protein
MIKHYVEFLYPGILVSETSSREVKKREQPRQIPRNCFGYRFFDRREAVVDGEKLVGKPHKFSGNFYFGEAMTLADVKKLQPRDNYKILIGNMESNGYKRVVKTEFGQFMPIEKGDKVLSPRRAQKKVS